MGVAFLLPIILKFMALLQTWGSVTGRTTISRFFLHLQETVRPFKRSHNFLKMQEGFEFSAVVKQNLSSCGKFPKFPSDLFHPWVETVLLTEKPVY